MTPAEVDAVDDDLLQGMLRLMKREADSIEAQARKNRR